jgi:predicted dithiol-disulfide oxidoreductase (DUF899 family)
MEAGIRSTISLRAKEHQVVLAPEDVAEILMMSEVVTAAIPHSLCLRGSARDGRESNGEIRHTWSSELLYERTDPGQDPRQVGTLEPLWNIFDLTPEGRPEDWNEQLQYPCCHRTSLE